MNLLPFLKVDRIIIGLCGDSHKDIFTTLIQPLIVDQSITDEAVFLSDLLQREEQITTAMEGGIAFPHARSHSVKKLGLVVGITGAEGVDFNPLGGEKIRLFFCIAVPATAPNSHMPLLTALARFSRDQKRLEKLFTYKTPTGVMNFIASYQGK
jgi:mannitol/fructose-specific phosphotransferase system IIA component (Ntr-type)